MKLSALLKEVKAKKINNASNLDKIKNKMVKNAPSAVEWLIDEIIAKQNGKGDSRSMDEIFEQAKEMDIQQKIKQFENAFKEGKKHAKYIYVS